ncbi:MAG: carbon storage regulator [Bdellovibrionaceae bacterium]|nr:carbon storage regulator [Pseudobdellovibrionaceae bacterium]
MLVLTRKVGETVNIDGDIVVQVVQVRGKQVRIGISAPKNKKVQRGELHSVLNKVLIPDSSLLKNQLKNDLSR